MPICLLTTRVESSWIDDVSGHVSVQDNAHAHDNAHDNGGAASTSLLLAPRELMTNERANVPGAELAVAMPR